MTSPIAGAIFLLRGHDGDAPSHPERASLRVPQLLALIVFYGAVYGAVMGSFSVSGSLRPLQWVFSALKVPLLLLVTFLLNLPSFFIFNTLAGLGDEFRSVLRSLLSAQAGQTVLLAALAPYVVLWNNSVTAYFPTILFNALLFGIASLGGHVLLRRNYRALIRRDARHARMLGVWTISYMFVGVQMGWVLRPFIGDPGKPTTFFRPDSWSNAYLALLQILHKSL